MRRLMVGLLSGSLALMLLPGVVAAQAADGCPATPGDDPDRPTWTLFAPIGDDVKFDKNGDGLICVKGVGQAGDYGADPAAPGNSITTILGPGGEYGATVKDNNSGKKQ